MQLPALDICITNKYFTVRHTVFFHFADHVKRIRFQGTALFIALPFAEAERQITPQALQRFAKWNMRNVTVFAAGTGDEELLDLSLLCQRFQVELVRGDASNAFSIDAEARDRSGPARLAEILAGDSAFVSEDPPRTAETAAPSSSEVDSLMQSISAFAKGDSELESLFSGFADTRALLKRMGSSERRRVACDIGEVLATAFDGSDDDDLDVLLGSEEEK